MKSKSTEWSNAISKPLPGFDLDTRVARIPSRAVGTTEPRRLPLLSRARKQAVYQGEPVHDLPTTRVFFIGVDLGQRQSNTAIVVLERFELQPEHYDVLRGHPHTRR